MRKLFYVFVFGLFVCAAPISAQVRPMEKKSAKSEAQTAPKTPAPDSFKAKYEGGIFGYDKKETGTLKFDDANSRIVFYGEDQKEKFSIPYKSMLVVYPQSRSVRSTTGTVISVIPLPGAGLAGLMRAKKRYLVINYDDPNVEAKGIANFKLDNKELLASVIDTLGKKAEMSARGDAFYRSKDSN
ncbi:MAG: hypothetical protein ABI891_06230 [Acidobacteriota bacterium]